MRQKAPLYIILFVLLISTGFTRDFRGEVVLHQNDTIRRLSIDSLFIARDSLVKDSLHLSDTLRAVSDTTNDDFLEFPAFSQARDSSHMEYVDGKNGKKRIHYYFGDVKVSYGNLSMGADFMRYDEEEQIVFAKGIPDTNGIVQQHPIMKDNGQEYTMEEVTYNFKTKKARITNMITSQNKGAILYGENLKMMPDKSINITQGRYTVCDHEHPHYYLRLTAAKVITEPKQRTVFGPAFIVVEDVPLLPIVIPFGFVPEIPDRAAGIMIPTVGEERGRGFYMRGLGYYIVLGDYFDLQLSSDIYTLGSWGINADTRYKLRYKFNGGFTLGYSTNQIGERGDQNFSLSKDFKVTWRHSQDPKARPGTNFSANVNFSSPSNNKYNSGGNINEIMNNSTSSSISYSKTWSKMNLSINALHSQNTRDASYSITLPNITFNVNRFYPFKSKNRVGKERIYEQITFGYNTTFRNSVSFKVSDFVTGKDDDGVNVFMSRDDIVQELFDNHLSSAMNHNFQIGLPQFALFKFFNFSPSVSYGMNWYFRDQEAYYDDKDDRVAYNKNAEYSTLGAFHTLSGSISLTTRLYGIYEFGEKSAINKMRHMFSPSVSFSFSPELSGKWNGWEEFIYTDKIGNQQSHIYNRFGASGSYSKSGVMSYSLGNTFDGRVRDRNDTTGTGYKMVKLIDQINITSGYDFFREKNKMNPIGVTINTNLLQKVNISANLNFDPYAIDEKGTTLDEFRWTKERKIARMTGASISFAYSFNGEGKSNGNDGANDNNVNRALSGNNYNRVYYHPITGEYIPGGWVYYNNPNVPWNISFNYSYIYSKPTLTASHTQTLGITGSVRITNALNINFNSGVDLMKMKLTTTHVDATYDLHCFQISFGFTPFGQYKSWSFNIAAKASELANVLKFKKDHGYLDN